LGIAHGGGVWNERHLASLGKMTPAEYEVAVEAVHKELLVA
jgi:hypothetical protein